MKRFPAAVLQVTVTAIFCTGWFGGLAAADPPTRYVALQLAAGEAAGELDAVARFALNGRAAPGEWSRSSLGDGAGLALELGQIRHHRIGALRLGLELGLRAGHPIASDSGFRVRGLPVAGDAVLAASGRATTRLELRSTTVMAVLRQDLGALAFGGVTPWVGAGIGWSRNRVEGFRIDYRAGMVLDGPGRHGTARFPHATQFVPARRFDDLAWEISAGLSRPLRPGWHASLGVRRASLGAYRLAGSGDGPARLGLDGEMLAIGFDSGRQHLRLHEVTLTLRHDF